MVQPHTCNPSPFGAPLPSCYIHDVNDALFVLSGWYHGVIPLCNRHLSPQEKDMYIVSGWTLIFPSALSKVKRWRDQYFWSTSRVVGPFFLYRQLYEPGRPARSNSKTAQPPTRRRAVRAPPPPPPQLSPEDADDWDSTEFDWWIVGTKRRGEKLTRGGFCRKTLTVDFLGTEYRVVSYYNPLDAHRGVLPRASEHDKLAGLGLHPVILEGARCKMNSRIVKCHRLSEWLSEEQLSDHVDSPSETAGSSDMESEDPLYDEAEGQEIPADVSDDAQSDQRLVQAEGEERFVQAEVEERFVQAEGEERFVQAEREERIVQPETETDECLFDAHGDVESEDSLFDALDDAGSESSVFDPCDDEGMDESCDTAPVEADNESNMDLLSDVAHVAGPAASPSSQTAVHGTAFGLGAFPVPALVADVDSAVVSDFQANEHADIFDCLGMAATSQVRQASPMDFGDLLSSTLAQPEPSSASWPLTGVCESCGQSINFSHALGNAPANHGPLPESEMLTVAQFLNKFFPDYDFGACDSPAV